MAFVWLCVLKCINIVLAKNHIFSPPFRGKRRCQAGEPSWLRFVNFGRIHISGVTVDEPRECRDAHQAVFKQRVCQEAAEYAQGHVDDVMMGGVDGGEPYADSDHKKKGANPEGGFGFERVDERHEGVGRVERRHGGEHIGVAPVKAVENPQAGHLVEPPESGHFAGGGEVEPESVEGHIPWRRGGMDVISGEADEVDKQEHQGEMEICFALSTEVEPKAEE